MCKYCFIHYLQIDEKQKIKKILKIYNSKNQIKNNFKRKKLNYDMVDASCKLFLELYFQEMKEQPFLTRKIKLFSILSKII